VCSVFALERKVASFLILNRPRVTVAATGALGRERKVERRESISYRVGVFCSRLSCEEVRNFLQVDIHLGIRRLQRLKQLWCITVYG
jgi:hypothetical protein